LSHLTRFFLSVVVTKLVGTDPEVQGHVKATFMRLLDGLSEEKKEEILMGDSFHRFVRQFSGSDKDMLVRQALGMLEPGFEHAMHQLFEEAEEEAGERRLRYFNIY
jgi:hypothetical protein